MIVRPRLHWLKMAFVLRGSVVLDILPQWAATTVFAIIVTVLHGTLFRWKVTLTFVPFSLIGFMLAIFLGFRLNTSYARYWEARMLWGAVLNDTRSVTRQALSYIADAAVVRPFVNQLIAFLHALRHQLRRTDPMPELQKILPPDECAWLAPLRFKPNMLLLTAGRWLGEQVRAGKLQPALAQAMEEPMDGISTALGGCERIASTPIPFTYTLIIHRTIYTYCFLLPFGLIDAIGYMTPFIVAFIAYTFFALEALSAEIEDPFGMEPNDLALTAMSNSIEATLREMMGEQPAPPAPPRNGYLLD